MTAIFVLMAESNETVTLDSPSKRRSRNVPDIQNVTSYRYRHTQKCNTAPSVCRLQGLSLAIEVAYNTSGQGFGKMTGN
jgi:hypothetical protein